MTPYPEDKLGPDENQSYIAKNRPTEGARVDASDDLEFSLIGGNKESSTGGSRDQYNPNPGPVERAAGRNSGIETPDLPYEKNFDEGSDYAQDSIGASLDSGSIDEQGSGGRPPVD